MAGTVFHAPLIRAAAGLELAAIAGSEESAEVIRDPSIELVVVATPNLSHFPLARAALEAGKHVVVDKPFTVTMEDADSLIALASERGRVLSVFHNRRWDGDFLTVRRLIDEGRLGEVSLLEAHWDRFRPAIKKGWREVPAEGAGLLNDLAPHMIDQALLLFGTPEAIAADVQTQREEAAVDDYFDLTFFYGRRRVRLSASTMIAAPRPRFAVHGSEGSFVKFGLDPQEAVLRSGGDPLDEEAVRDRVDGTLTRPDGSSEPVPTTPGRYLDFYRSAAAAIRTNAPVPVDPADAREGLRLIELARRSAREGRRLSC